LIPQRVRPSVHDDGVEAGIAENHLEPGSGGRIARDDAVDVIEKTLEHQRPRDDILAARRSFLDS